MKNIFLLMLIFFSKPLASQNYRLEISKGKSMAGFVLDMSILKKNKKTALNDSLIQLKNGIKINEYKIFEKTIQNVPANKYNTIVFFVGYSFNELIMLVDLNRNADFSDDSVYTYKPKQIKMSNKEFRNSLPLIKLDSLQIIDEKGKISFYSTSIRISPTLKFTDLYSGYSSSLKDNELNLLVFSDSFYTTKNFIIDKEIYHIEIVPHSFIFPVYPISNSNYSRANIALIKHVTEDSFTLAGFQTIEYMLSENKIMSIQNEMLQLKNYDFNAKIIEFEIKQNMNFADSNLSYFSSFKYLSMKDRKNHFISLSQKKYTVIEFGGSWCKPCNEIIPQIDRFYKKNKDSVNFISVFKEGNLLNAIKYYKNIKPQWEAYFEALQCNEAKCLAKLFGVGVYPTILLLDERANLLFRADGSGCVKSLESFLKNTSL